MSIESHLDNVFTEGARQRKAQCAGKIYKYKAYKSHGLSSTLIAEGRCEVLDVSYEKFIDCDVYTIRDIDTGVQIRKNQFDLILKEDEG